MSTKRARQDATTLATTSGGSFHVGDILTIAGVERLDPRRWPRFKAWLLRRPAPTLGPQRFQVTNVFHGEAAPLSARHSKERMK